MIIAKNPKREDEFSTNRSKYVWLSPGCRYSFILLFHIVNAKTLPRMHAIENCSCLSTSRVSRIAVPRFRLYTYRISHSDEGIMPIRGYEVRKVNF